MKSRATENASVEKTENGYLLKIPNGDSSAYRFAQIDDYFGLKRKNFPHQNLTLSLRARTSAVSLPGTWGFGLWNDPFGASLGFGGNKFRLPTLPNAAWFFGASKENYLSFQNDKPANGFITQSFRSPKFHPLLIPAGIAFPFSKKQTRKFLGKIIMEDSFLLESDSLLFEMQKQTQQQAVGLQSQSQSVDPTQWHSYKLEWSEKRVAWVVDDVLVFESLVSPNPPLGLVIWIDNQFASFTPDGKIGFGVLEGGAEWLEVKDIVMSEK